MPVVLGRELLRLIHFQQLNGMEAIATAAVPVLLQRCPLIHLGPDRVEMAQRLA
jgi:hypothetical protein